MADTAGVGGGIRETKYRLRRIAGRSFLHVCWTENGRTRTVSSRTEDWARAQRFLEGWIGAEHHDPTVGELLAWYIHARSRAGVIHIKRLHSSAKPLAAHFGELRSSAVSGEAVAAYRVARDHCAPGTIRRDLTVLRAALNHAHREGA